jgi:ribonuclease HI
MNKSDNEKWERIAYEEELEKSDRKILSDYDNPENWRKPLIGDPYYITPKNKITTSEKFVNKKQAKNQIKRQAKQLRKIDNKAKQLRKIDNQARRLNRKKTPVTFIVDKTLPTVKIYTDGGINHYLNIGSFCAILTAPNNSQKMFSGLRKQTTSNRMEIMAIIEGLRALKTRCNAIIYSDSQYTVNSIMKGWARNWKSNNWQNGDGNKQRLNWDLFEILLHLCEKHNVQLNWIPRNSMPLQAQCDKQCTGLILSSKGHEIPIDHRK